MKLEETNVKIRCDIPNCKEMAKYKIIKPGFLKHAGLYLCKECMKELYSTLAMHMVPKSPNNMLNKKIVNKKGGGDINERI